MSLYDFPAQEFNLALAEATKKIPEFKMPEWALFVKTSSSKVKPPVENDWWYNRVAGILRQAYTQRVIGVGRLRVRYGSKKNRGMKPEAFVKAGGKIIRTILQQAEKAGFLEKITQGKRRGRKLTAKGKEFLDSLKIAPKKAERIGEIVKITKQEEIKEDISNQEEIE